MNINKMLGIFGLQLKSKKEPIKKVSRNGLSQKYHKEYQKYHLNNGEGCDTCHHYEEWLKAEEKAVLL